MRKDSNLTCRFKCTKPTKTFFNTQLSIDNIEIIAVNQEGNKLVSVQLLYTDKKN